MSRPDTVVITGLGVVCPLGDSPQRVFDALLRGDTGLGPVELFEPEGLPPLRVGEVRDFDPSFYLGKGNLRPLDRTARLAAAAAALALEHSGWTPELREEHDVGLVLGTMFGSVHTISAFDRRALTAGPQYAKPMDFANSVINAAAGQTAIWHGLRGVNSTISGGSASGLQALAYAGDLVRSGRSEAILAGGAEELCHESVLGFLRTGQACPGAGDEACPTPFHRRRNGFTLGEGAALVMLERADHAARRGAPALAAITGAGNCYDPSRGRDPERSADALARAIALALQEAGLAPDQIDAVSSSANGSPGGDRQEALGLKACFNGTRPPVMAPKAALGEPLGAGGALQALALISALASGRLPAVRGLDEPDTELPVRLPAADGESLPPSTSGVRRGLVTSLGLDGNACAVVLEVPATEG
ncbi:MAG: beta-ketoacyl synthase N-terminal-like domain-containing protein [Acidobacteriota bacterium]|nr:beta-ketoacyl synthase N-terminal-like domain-containing protein [Acidobacteriota bacterium]